MHDDSFMFSNGTLISTFYWHSKLGVIRDVLVSRLLVDQPLDGAPHGAVQERSPPTAPQTRSQSSYRVTRHDFRPSQKEGVRTKSIQSGLSRKREIERP